MPETRIIKESLLALARVPGVRAWRANTGMAVAWGEVQRAIATQSWEWLRKARPIRFGVPGQADITGIAPDGRRLEVETKTESGRQSEVQRNFERMIRKHGGIYVLARSAQEAVEKTKTMFDTPEEQREVERLEDIIRWFEFRNGHGDTYLDREMYEADVAEGRWDPEVGE